MQERYIVASVSEIRYVAYAVPDLAAERAFYADKWGLKETVVKDGCVYFGVAEQDEPFVVRLRAAGAAHVDVIALAAPARADVDALYARVQQSGCRTIFAPRSLATPGGGYGFRFFSPDGLPFEISAEVARGPTRKLEAGEAIPARISHIVLHSPDHKALVRFFVEVLGMRISDWLGDFMCFLRCNEWHHRIAILPGPPCLNHVAWDMASLDAMMRGVARLRALDVDLRWGPGRHKAGNNTFSYFVTPNGFVAEYTAELERVNESTWQPTVYQPDPGLMDVWGIGVGGPHAMPHAAPDRSLFQPADV
jgi:catechol 2,3-dioxygenase-like lactoylglutathione lyase family enzyme